MCKTAFPDPGFGIMEGSIVDRNVIDADNAFLKQMIDLIPPHFYFDNDTKEEIHDMLEDDKEQKPERGEYLLKKLPTVNIIFLVL